MSLLLRNIVFTVLQPGIVAGLIPYWIAGEDFRSMVGQPFGIFQYLGAIDFTAGICITCYCIVLFGMKGRGTLSPADPTKRLVIAGLYRYSRNPMYVGVMMVLTGELLFTMNLQMLYYSILIFAAFNLFILFREEPRLTRDFGEDYLNYRKKVRRWF